MQQNITETMRVEVEKLYANSRVQSDPKDWARRILDKHLNDQKVHRCTLLFAKQALRLEVV